MAAATLPTNGATIRAIRQAYGLSLAQLAEAAQISEGYLSRVERGTNASAPVLRRIADRLRVPFDAVVSVKVIEKPEHVVPAAA